MPAGKGRATIARQSVAPARRRSENLHLRQLALFPRLVRVAIDCRGNGADVRPLLAIQSLAVLSGMKGRVPLRQHGARNDRDNGDLAAKPVLAPAPCLQAPDETPVNLRWGHCSVMIIAFKRRVSTGPARMACMVEIPARAG